MNLDQIRKQFRNLTFIKLFKSKDSAAGRASESIDDAEPFMIESLTTERKDRHRSNALLKICVFNGPLSLISDDSVFLDPFYEGIR